MILQDLSSTARNAHNWTSFDPDKRGDQAIKDYSQELEADITTLKAEGIEEDIILSYTNRYKALISSYWSASSRCASSFITGGSNFPVRQQEKRRRSRERHYEVFREWRQRAMKAIVRKSKPEKTYLSELDRYRLDLSSMKANHDKMKAGNKAIAQAKKSGADITEYLITEFGIAPHMIHWTLKFGFGLSNNLANIKRVEDRIKLLESKETARTEGVQREYQFEGGKIVLNYEADRLQIIHDTKPEPSVIQGLKQNGFKWSPTNSGLATIPNQ